MSGKNKCKILKQIRQKIAQENDIAYVTSECKYQGECSGTCPKCEAEAEALSRALERRRVRLSEKPIEIKNDEVFEPTGKPEDLWVGEVKGPWDDPFGSDDGLWN